MDLEVFVERVRSAVEARQDPDFVIIARTDARQAQKFGGPDAGQEAFDDGVRRLKAAVKAGADMVFMESPRTEDECRTLVKEMGDVPVLINVLPNVRLTLGTSTQCTHSSGLDADSLILGPYA